MAGISRLRQKLFILDKRREALLQQVTATGKMLPAAFYERFTRCHRPGCKCASGQLHGPFPWIYQRLKGQKLISTSCVADKVEEARLLAGRYKSFRENWTQIRRLEEGIHQLIGEIATLEEVAVQPFIHKEGERRGRKQKESLPGDPGETD